MEMRYMIYDVLWDVNIRMDIFVLYDGIKF
jgi:hypothetical protein